MKKSISIFLNILLVLVVIVGFCVNNMMNREMIDTLNKQLKIKDKNLEELKKSNEYLEIKLAEVEKNIKAVNNEIIEIKKN